LVKESQKKHIREGTPVFSVMWADFVEKGDIIFTAADSDDGSDITAMSVLLKHLYGIET
jgi:hypothetical protein